MMSRVPGRTGFCSVLGRVRMFGARLWARMPPEYVAALKAFALQSDVPLAEYVRGMVHGHVLQRGAAFPRKRCRFESSRQQERETDR